MYRKWESIQQLQLNRQSISSTVSVSLYHLTNITQLIISIAVIHTFLEQLLKNNLTHQWLFNFSTARQRHPMTEYVRWLESADDCHGSTVTDARGGGTADNFAGGGGGSIAGLSIHDGLTVTEDRCSVKSDEEEFHGSAFLPSTSCSSRNGSITCYNIELSPHWLSDQFYVPLDTK